MQELQFPLADLIAVTEHCPPDAGWPSPSPFNLRFTEAAPSPELSGALAGPGVYLISYKAEVIYIGMYRPAKGRIVDDRWKRHLQTLTGRGINIGFGGASNPQKRRDLFLASVEAEGLRSAIQHAYTYSRPARFRDTGFNTTPNRLRFASEQWAVFGSAGPADILRGFDFWLLRTRLPAMPQAALQEVHGIEAAVLQTLRPLCNREYRHPRDGDGRPNCTVENLTRAVRQAALRMTGQDITHRVRFVT